MSRSIRVTMTRPTTDTVWPFDISPWNSTLLTNFLNFEDNNIQSWILGDEDDDLVVIVDHYFSDDSTFLSLKDHAYARIPLWTNNENRTESDEYCLANNITIEIVEVENPDLVDYTRIDENRRRTYTAINAIN